MSIDTSKMSKDKAAALDIAEAARDEMKDKSLAGGLFVGELNHSNALPFPTEEADSAKESAKYVAELSDVMETISANDIDRLGEIPDDVLESLASIKAFAAKIPEKYGGRGLSQMGYSRGAMVTGKYCGNIAALLSAHQSIGVPQPLLMYGTDEQKEKYLPTFAAGAISAFALTEDGVGSDPAKVVTTAEPSLDGNHFIINGTKLWCTNGVKATTIIVMARTPDKNGRKQITAFIVDMNMPGIEVLHRCHFMGLKALYNGVIQFTNVKVPKENIVLAEGKGMRVALNTLNIGRLTIPAICVGASKYCLEMVREWASTRVQWGQAVGKHQLISDKISRMASDIYAMEAMIELCANTADKKTSDIRVESAMAKMWATETYWRIVDDAMQVKGGRGYEIEQSLTDRGDKPDPIERMFRDSRINLIFEGSSEIMRLILAREALDPHLKIAGDVVNSRAPIKKRIKAAIRAGLHYAWWYPKQWLPVFRSNVPGLVSELSKYIRYVRRASKRLARTLFHSMLRHGPGLDKQQLLLSRLTEIGTELFVISTAVFKTNSKLRLKHKNSRYFEIMDIIFENSKQKIEQNFRDIRKNPDKKNYKFARQVLDGKYRDMEIVP
tara:strand:- start:1526 stop:3358 length:1833 start_codon:yes stop_codon:yes gene_type:complete